MHLERLDPNTVYGRDSNLDVQVVNVIQNLNHNVEPWSTGHSFDQFGVEHWTRPWFAPENQGVPHTYKHPVIVFPPCYDTNPSAVSFVQVLNPGTPPVVNFIDVPAGETASQAIIISAYTCQNVHLLITAGPTVLTGPPGTNFGTPQGTSVVIPHILSLAPSIGNLGISYKGTHGGDVATGTVTIHCTETNQDFIIQIMANTIGVMSVAVRRLARARIRVTVTDSVDNSPVAGATVTVFGNNGQTEASGATAANGTVDIRYLPCGEYDPETHKLLLEPCDGLVTKRGYQDASFETPSR